MSNRSAKPYPRARGEPEPARSTEPRRSLKRFALGRSALGSLRVPDAFGWHSPRSRGAALLIAVSSAGTWTAGEGRLSLAVSTGPRWTGRAEPECPADASALDQDGELECVPFPRRSARRRRRESRAASDSSRRYCKKCSGCAAIDRSGKSELQSTASVEMVTSRSRT